MELGGRGRGKSWSGRNRSPRYFAVEEEQMSRRVARANAKPSDGTERVSVRREVTL
ncbi:hypothetical protein [Plantactinospora sp. BB1]|uniref:hypothetical protein n=1 Tax=Plantactinospora sp. BB1 TaxID=2071627 RepID=UPI00131F015D|nr:hypothetical protein [Plantactinospora sp. BB1]